ncbi:MAG: putative oxidoreductase C-terminal domain-containing protein [Balneolales bacterium]
MKNNNNKFTGADGEVRLMTLNPGHFHAALVQKNMLNQVSPTANIYAPEGADLDLHLERIKSFNSRKVNPANWQTEVHASADFFSRMLKEQPGNVMITAGNNREKAEYIKRAVDAGINVLSDKPMVINKEGWELLVSAFRSAAQNDVLIYDIMTERNEITSNIQRRLAQNKSLFGELQKGSPDKPAIVKESVHHLLKEVSGIPLRRPPWYFDVKQQGEGIVDVTTHLVDLSMWGAFPNQVMDYQKDIQMLKASRWPTQVSLKQFNTMTGESQFPDYLQDQVIDGVLPLYSNGEILFKLRGHHTRVWVKWDYQAAAGGGDTHFSLFRGTRSSLVIRQGKEQNFKSTLYVEPSQDVDHKEIDKAFKDAVTALQNEYPELTYKPAEKGWELSIPDKYYLGHEAHFGTVAQNYYGYLVDGKLPDWEVPNMITKYYVTTQALEMALKNAS